MSLQNVNTPASESKESSPDNRSDSVRFFSHLHVRDAQGNYVMATVSQILTEATRAIDFRYPTGSFFESAAVSAVFLRSKLVGLEREVFAVAFLNNQHQLLAYEELFAGSITSTHIYPGEVARAALRHNAAAVIVSYNHPPFSTEPSRVDVQITFRLKKTLELIDVRMIDHIVVAGNDAIPMAERGFV